MARPSLGKEEGGRPGACQAIHTPESGLGLTSSSLDTWEGTLLSAW